MFVNKYLITSILLLLAGQLSTAQSVKSWLPVCDLPQPGDPVQELQFNQWKFEPNNRQEAAYRIACDSFRSIFGRPVKKVTVVLDTSNIVSRYDVYLNFDTTLHTEIERLLGKPEGEWMAVAPDLPDKEHMIYNRSWKLPAFTLRFQCTRYMPFLGEELDDFIILSILAPAAKR